MSDHPQQSYFCICAPVPGMPTGNRFPYGVCGPFLDEKEGQEAVNTDRYTDLDGALRALIIDCAVSGVKLKDSDIESADTQTITGDLFT